MRSETDGIVVNRREKREQLHTVKKVDLPEAQSVSQAVTSSNSPCYSSFIYKKKQKKFLVCCERFKVVVYCVYFLLVTKKLEMIFIRLGPLGPYPSIQVAVYANDSIQIHQHSIPSYYIGLNGNGQDNTISPRAYY